MDRLSVSLRGLAALAVVCCLACLVPAGAGAAPLLWALNSGEDSVSTFEGSTGRAVGLPISTGADPISIAITPDGKRAYVANFVGKSVTVIEVATRLPIAAIELEAPAEQIAISPDGANAYVTTGSDQKVVVINTATNLVERSVPLGAATSAIAAGVVEPFGGPPDEFVYVGLAPNEVQAVNPARGSLVNSAIEVGGEPQAIAFSPSGNTAYVAAGEEVDVIVGGAVVKEIPLSGEASALAVSPDGTRVYATSAAARTFTTISVATNKVLGTPIAIKGEPQEIALTAGGRTAYVATGNGITPVNTATGTAGTPIARPGAGISSLVVAPDQAPVAAFDPPAATAGTPATFSAAASTDPDSTIASYLWSMNDAASSTGLTITHTFAYPGTYFTILTLTDDEGCSVTQVFTGRTAYCNGSSLASITHPVTVKAAPPAAPVCSHNFGVGGVSHNRKNGTVRLRLRFPSTGYFLLFGKKIHAVTRKVRKPGVAVVTLHARVELNKRLKTTLRAGVRYRITFTPSAGCGSKTVHRSVALLRAPRHKHHR